MSDILKKYRASNPVDEVLVETLEIIHSGLPEGIVRFARSCVDITADTATASGVVFQKSAIGVASYPEKGVTGNQDIVVTVSNVNLQAWGYAKSINTANRAAREPAFINVMLYLLSDLTAPQETYATEAKRISSEGSKVTIVAGYKELFNRSAFNLRYNSTDHPGLKYQ